MRKGKEMTINMTTSTEEERWDWIKKGDLASTIFIVCVRMAFLSHNKRQYLQKE